MLMSYVVIVMVMISLVVCTVSRQRWINYHPTRRSLSNAYQSVVRRGLIAPYNSVSIVFCSRHSVNLSHHIDLIRLISDVLSVAAVLLHRLFCVLDRSEAFHI